MSAPLGTRATLATGHTSKPERGHSGGGDGRPTMHGRVRATLRPRARSSPLDPPRRARIRCAAKDPTYRVSAPKTMPSANTTPAMVVPVFTGLGMVYPLWRQRHQHSSTWESACRKQAERDMQSPEEGLAVRAKGGGQWRPSRGSQTTHTDVAGKQAAARPATAKNQTQRNNPHALAPHPRHPRDPPPARTKTYCASRWLLRRTLSKEKPPRSLDDNILAT